MPSELKEFCHKYDAYVTESSRMHRRARHLDYKMWSESDPSDFAQIPYETVKCVEIHMPEDRFRALIEHDEWVSKAGLFDNNHFNNNVSRVANLVVQMERETRIRHENPTVRLAYEKYQSLLRLVDSGYE